MPLCSVEGQQQVKGKGKEREKIRAPSCAKAMGIFCHFKVPQRMGTSDDEDFGAAGSWVRCKDPNTLSKSHKAEAGTV